MERREANDAQFIVWPDPTDGSVWFGVWPIAPNAEPPPTSAADIKESGAFESAAFAMRLSSGATLNLAWQFIQAAVLAAHYAGHRCNKHVPPEEESASGPAMSPEEMRRLWRYVDGNKQRGQEETGSGTSSDS